MANYLTTDTELTSIANAIRTKGGTQAQLTYPTGFVSAINDIPTGGGGSIVLTGDISNGLKGNVGTILVNSGSVSTSDITNLEYAFAGNLATTIPFAINVKANQQNLSIREMFSGCSNLTTLPTINWNNAVLTSSAALGRLFADSPYLVSIPDFFDGLDLSTWHNTTSNTINWFNGDARLKTISPNLLAEMYTKTTSNQAWRQAFYGCHCLEEIHNLGLFHPDFTCSSNIVSNGSYIMFNLNCSLRSLTFDADGAARNYSNQDIDLTHYVGYANNSYYNDNFGATGGTSLEDSVYNHASAVETINSLPDCSAVSPPSAPTNTIKFKAGAGANTAGGDISDLTAEEIAVATNKGWAVQIVA